MSEKRGSNKYEEDQMDLRRGPWTLEEDTLLIHYIACHGEGRWNHLAKCSGNRQNLCIVFRFLFSGKLNLYIVN